MTERCQSPSISFPSSSSSPIVGGEDGCGLGFRSSAPDSDCDAVAAFDFDDDLVDTPLAEEDPLVLRR